MCRGIIWRGSDQQEFFGGRTAAQFGQESGEAPGAFGTAQGYCGEGARGKWGGRLACFGDDQPICNGFRLFLKSGTRKVSLEQIEVGSPLLVRFSRRGGSDLREKCDDLIARTGLRDTRVIEQRRQQSNRLLADQPIGVVQAAPG